MADLSTLPWLEGYKSGRRERKGEILIEEVSTYSRWNFIISITKVKY